MSARGNCLCCQTRSALKIRAIQRWSVNPFQNRGYLSRDSGLRKLQVHSLEVAAHPGMAAAAFALVCLLFSGCATISRSGGEKTCIPRIARFAQVRIGFSTQADLTKRWGEGLAVTGGHPNSGRVWRVRDTPWEMHTDAFEYSERGLVVDALRLEADTTWGRSAPIAQLYKEDFTWLGGVSLGASEDKVRKILRRQSLPVIQKQHGLEVQAAGFHALKSGAFRNWTAAFEFEQGRLIRLTLQAAERR